MEMVATGASDQSIANQVGNGIGRMAVSRHRRNHIAAPAKLAAEIAAKGQDVAATRVHTMAAAEAGDPTAFLALTAIVVDLKAVHDRLERTAGAAENDNQRLTVASLSAQQLRATEVRAKMGGIGGYAPGAAGGGPAPSARFAVNITFGGGKVETITADFAPAGRITEAELVSDD